MGWQYDNPYDAGYYSDGIWDDDEASQSNDDSDVDEDDDCDCDDYEPMTNYEHYVNANF